MKRIHILTAALLATGLAVPAAFAQTSTGTAGNGGNTNGAAGSTGIYNNAGGYSSGGRSDGYNTGANSGSGGGGNYNNNGYGYGAGGNANGANGSNSYRNTSYGYSGNGQRNGQRNGQGNGNNGGNGSMGSHVGAGAVLTVAPSGVREVQQALNRLGYQSGPINGIWDRSTANAMLNFQQAHGLAPTGNLNLSSVAALGLWHNVIGNPIGNGNRALFGTNGAPPNRGGRRGVSIGGERLPSQRIINGSSDVGNGGGRMGGGNNGGNGGGR